MKSLLMTEKESSGIEGRGQPAVRQKKQVGSAGLKEEEEEEHMQLEERNIKMPLIHVKSFTCMFMFPNTVKDMQKQNKHNTQTNNWVFIWALSVTLTRDYWQEL